MRFVDISWDSEGSTRTAFHKLDADIQLAIEELSHTLAGLGVLIELTLNEDLQVVIRIPNQD